MNFGELFNSLDLPLSIAACVYLWNRWQREAQDRERRLCARLDKMEERDRADLVALSKESSDAIRENYRVVRRITAATQDMVNSLKSRPCLTDDSFYPHQTEHAIHNLPRVTSPTGETTKPTSHDVGLTNG